MEGGGAAPEGEGALPSSRLAAPLKGTKLGSATSGSDVLSAKPIACFDCESALTGESAVTQCSQTAVGECSHTAVMQSREGLATCVLLGAAPVYGSSQGVQTGKALPDGGSCTGAGVGSGLVGST